MGRADNLSEGGGKPSDFEDASGLSRIILERMPRADYRRCRNCRRPSTEVGPLSHTRLCAECGRLIEIENAVQIHLREGPYYERRRYGVALAEFGPRVALALKQAGIFDPPTVDTSTGGT